MSDEIKTTEPVQNELFQKEEQTSEATEQTAATNNTEDQIKKLALMEKEVERMKKEYAGVMRALNNEKKEKEKYQKAAMTDEERIQEKEKQLLQREQLLLRKEIRSKYGLDEEWIDHLNGSTEEEIEDSAQKIQKKIEAAANKMIQEKMKSMSKTTTKNATAEPNKTYTADEIKNAYAIYSKNRLSMTKEERIKEESRLKNMIGA